MMDYTDASDSNSEPTNSTDSKHDVHGGVIYPSNVPHQPHSRMNALTFGKGFLYFLLCAITIGSAVAVQRYTSRSQELDLQDHAAHITNQIISVYTFNAIKIVDVCKSFAATVTTSAVGTNASWPFAVVSGFEYMASLAMDSIGAQEIVLSPFVQEHERDAWETFVVQHGNSWIEEGYQYQNIEGERPTVYPSIHTSLEHYIPSSGTSEEFDFYAPVWQYSPLLGTPNMLNFDTLSDHIWEHALEHVLEENSPILSHAIVVSNSTSNDPADWPSSMIMVPIYNTVELTPSADKIVAILAVTLPWHSYFEDLLPDSIEPLTLVIENTCDRAFSYEIVGPSVTYIGPGDLHDPAFEYLGQTNHFKPLDLELECEYALSIYPTKQFASAESSNAPLIYTAVVVSIFLFTISVFMLYDLAVERRQDRVAERAERSDAIVASLFPREVARRLMEDSTNDAIKESKTHDEKGDAVVFLKDHHSKAHHSESRPIAELFPSASVMFADIVGFTAWSSEREPSQVFELLEKIYASFDQVAKRKGIFKVETIGDCYMAAAGLPERRDDHAIALACFARDCVRKMIHVVRKLESSLGPSTGELSIRIGIHSGPVTAGVLRGEKARFQLFGDTVNTAARMESTGQPNKIQVSAETAALISESVGKDIWVTPRRDEVEAKGKGKLHTFWVGYSAGSGSSKQLSSSALDDTSRMADSTEGSSSGNGEEDTGVLPPDSIHQKRERSLDWTTDILLNMLQRVMAMRGKDHQSIYIDRIQRHPGSLPLEEVVEVINLHSQERSYLVNPEDVEIPKVVATQLHSYVREIASLYNPNHFHNFEHATHVAMSVTKLLSRVMAPEMDGSNEPGENLHKYTFGITSDPLAQFAVTFAALIHDVDHHGVPNATLVQEKTTNARHYKNLSVAEQNSVDIAWELLSFDAYAELRACIYSSEEEFRRFRQLVVNAVMATDIADKELGAARKARWVKAFEGVEADMVVDANRKATIVIEHLIQASDVAHTMQHWHVYIRWNERFFYECYTAYLAGRAEKDPSIDWYTSEMGFFDFYIIPLAKKLKECQVFGVASDEYLNYAEANRKEWEMKGRALVEEYIVKYKNGEYKRVG